MKSLALPICLGGASGAGGQEVDAAGQRGQGLSLGSSHRSVRGHCPPLAVLVTKQLLVPGCSRKAEAGAPSQPLTVPLGRTCGPSCHQGLVPSTLTSADRWTWRGAGGGRKLLIPLYLLLTMLSSPCHALRLAWYLTLLFPWLPGC